MSADASWLRRPCSTFHVSGDSFELDERQMLPAGVVADQKHDLPAGFTIDGRCRRRTRRVEWPKWPYLDARLFVCGGAVVVDFVGRSTADEFVRSMLVVPAKMTDQFSSHVFSSQWNGDSSCALVFERADETFDNSDAPVFANGSKTRFDALRLHQVLNASHQKPLTPGPPTHGHAESNFLSVIAMAIDTIKLTFKNYCCVSDS